MNNKSNYLPFLANLYFVADTLFSAMIGLYSEFSISLSPADAMVIFSRRSCSFRISFQIVTFVRARSFDFCSSTVLVLLQSLKYHQRYYLNKLFKLLPFINIWLVGWLVCLQRKLKRNRQ